MAREEERFQRMIDGRLPSSVVKALFTAIFLALSAGGVARADTARLSVPEAFQGATALTVGFEPATQLGDQLSFVHNGMDWEVYGGSLPEGRREMMMPGPSDPGEYTIVWRDAGDRVKGQATMDVTGTDVWVNGAAIGKAGQGVLIDWQGPGFEGDSILLYRYADDMYLEEVKLGQENPVLLPLDVEPGDYEVLYWYDATDSILVREWLTVE